MKFKLATAFAPLILLLAASSPAALADQTDPLLDSLFATLQSDDLPSHLEAEGQIWSIWYDSGDEAIEELMANGREAAQRGQSKVAEAFYSQVIEQAPNYAEGWNRRATIRFYRKDYNGSLADIQQTIKLEPRHFGAIGGLGLILSAQQRYAEAIIAYQHLLEIKPHSRDVKSRIETLREKLLESAV